MQVAAGRGQFQVCLAARAASADWVEPADKVAALGRAAGKTTTAMAVRGGAGKATAMGVAVAADEEAAAEVLEVLVAVGRGAPVAEDLAAGAAQAEEVQAEADREEAGDRAEEVGQEVADSGVVVAALGGQVAAVQVAAVQVAVAVASAAQVAKEVPVAKGRRKWIFCRRGLTLLELILALALSVLVLMAIGMAINLHYRMFDVRRTNIEEAHVARATLRIIADDLRGAVWYVPPDLSGLDTVAGNTASAAANLATSQIQSAAAGAGVNLGGTATGAGGSSGSGTTSGSQTGASPTGFQQFTQATQGTQSSQGTQSGQNGSSSGGNAQTGGTTGVAGFGNGFTGTTPQTGSTATAATANGTTEETAELGTPITVVGLYGSTSTLQFDVSRLPRVDEYEAIMSPTSEMGVVDIPSDIKTVTYFVASEATTDASQAGGLFAGSPEPSATGRGRGLMRSELSHAVSAWAESNGNLNSTYANAKLLADEVVGLQFRYFDGTGWYDDWNSDDLGCLPSAVEITVTIQPTYGMSEEDIAELAVDELPPERMYSLIVNLPAALPPEPAAPVDTAAGDSAVMEEEVLP
ncbi:MAG TPA: hypothetical protein VFV87_06570 [Pirellulaceae bacterium]|nr:hypothetical protein [Pirellulaceae bacterium]